jgi:uncharacterized protein (DUF58 family)
VLTLSPRPRLLAALVLGAGLVLLTLISPVFWVLVVGFHAVLLWAVMSDAARLPSRSGFAVNRNLPRPFSLGAEETVIIGVENPKAAGLSAELADHAPAELNPRPRTQPGVFDTAGLLIAEYRTQPPHRGSYQFGPVDLRVWRPRGWLVRQLTLPAAEAAAVYPDVLAIKRYELMIRRGMRIMAGLRRARPPGAATAFAGLRDYSPGDDIRRVSWKATARRDSPVVVEVEAERGQQALIAIDCGRLMTAPAGLLTKLDHAVNAALLLAWVAQSQGDRVGLMTFSDGVHQFAEPQRGAAQVSRLSRLLYAIQPDYTEPDFGDAFSQLQYRLGRRSLVVVLTDILDPEASRELVAHSIRLSRRHLVLVVAMADPELLAARDSPIDRSSRVYEWAAAEELLASRRQSFEAMQRGGVLGLDVPAGQLSPAVVERYLELKERALL